MRCFGNPTFHPDRTHRGKHRRASQSRWRPARRAKIPILQSREAECSTVFRTHITCFFRGFKALWNNGLRLALDCGVSEGNGTRDETQTRLRLALDCGVSETTSPTANPLLLKYASPTPNVETKIPSTVPTRQLGLGIRIVALRPQARRAPQRGRPTAMLC